MKDKEGSRSLEKLTFHLEISRTISFFEAPWNKPFSQTSNYCTFILDVVLLSQRFYDRLFNLLAAKWIIIREPLQGR